VSSYAAIELNSSLDFWWRFLLIVLEGDRGEAAEANDETPALTLGLWLIKWAECRLGRF